MIHNLFPIPIGIYELQRKINEDEINFVLKQDKRKNDDNKSSVDTYILKNLELKVICDFIEDSVQKYFLDVYCPPEKTKIKITQSWLNYTKKGEFHHKHSHPNSFISGVFYFQSDETLDKIYFYNDKYNQFNLYPKKWNNWNSKSWWFESKQGNLILFPSSLSHSVLPVESEKERISLSFNTFLYGEIGNEYELTSLKIGE